MARRKEEASLRFSSAARTISKASGGVGEDVVVAVGDGKDVEVVFGSVFALGVAASQAAVTITRTTRMKSKNRFIATTVARDDSPVLSAPPPDPVAIINGQ